MTAGQIIAQAAKRANELEKRGSHIPAIVRAFVGAKVTHNA
jgi:hypothetical protein